MVVEKKLDMKVLAEKDNLSDDDLRNIQAEVLAEENASKEGDQEDKPADSESSVEEEGNESEKGKEKEKESSEEDAEAKQAEEKRLLEANEEDLSDEDKSKRADLLKDAEESKQKKEEEEKKVREDLDKEIKTYAAEHKISEEEARTDFESREKILEKYKGDPKQLAIANLHLQRLYTKTQEELKAVKEAKPLEAAKKLTIEDGVKLIEEGKVVLDNGKVLTREDAVRIYREKYSDISDGLDDDAVVKLVAEKLIEGNARQQEKNLLEISAKSKEKRATLLNSLPETDKKFIPEIQPLLEKYPDAAIMSENFKLDDLVLWAKGKTYDKDIKEIGEKEYKRGLEQAKIIGQRPPLDGGHSKTKGKTKTSLTDEQKKTALDMYEGTTFTEQEKYDNYAELLEIDKQPKK